MSRKEPVQRLVSAGGVVYRIGENGVEVVLCRRNDPPLWALPKGTPEAGETREQTAVREVTEETGLEVEPKGFIDDIVYWFVRPSDRVRYHKTVAFYLMSATGGDTSLHDHEFDEARWLPAAEALEIMTYGNEVRVVEKSLSMASEEGRPASAGEGRS